MEEDLALALRVHAVWEKLQDLCRKNTPGHMTGQAQTMAVELTRIVFLADKSRIVQLSAKKRAQ